MRKEGGREGRREGGRGRGGVEEGERIKWEGERTERQRDRQNIAGIPSCLNFLLSNIGEPAA